MSVCSVKLVPLKMIKAEANSVKLYLLSEHRIHDCWCTEMEQDMSSSSSLSSPPSAGKEEDTVDL